MLLVSIGNTFVHSFQSIIRIGTFIRSVVIDNLSSGVERKHIGKATRCVWGSYADNEADLAWGESHTLLHQPQTLSFMLIIDSVSTAFG